MTDVVAAPNEASIRAAFAAAEKEDAFWREHYDAYLAQYPDQFVAVRRGDGQVVVASASLDYLIGYIDGKGLNVQQVWVKFLGATRERVLL